MDRVAVFVADGQKKSRKTAEQPKKFSWELGFSLPLSHLSQPSATLCCTPEHLRKLCVGLLMLAEVARSFLGFSFSKIRSQLYREYNFSTAFLQEDTPTSGQLFDQSTMLLKMV
jgi:hypothetical protein